MTSFKNSFVLTDHMEIHSFEDFDISVFCGAIHMKKLFRLGMIIILTRSCPNLNFHQQKSSIHMSQIFPALLRSRQAKRVRFFFPTKQVEKNIS